MLYNIQLHWNCEVKSVAPASVTSIYYGAAVCLNNSHPSIGIDQEFLVSVLSKMSYLQGRDQVNV